VFAPSLTQPQTGKVHEIVVETAPAPPVSEDLPAFYLRAVREKIETAWSRPPMNQPIVLRFTIERDGRTSDLRVDVSSGDTKLDDQALEAVRRAEPFMPLPDAYPRPPVIRLELK
jgi:TonB family protein